MKMIALAVVAIVFVPYIWGYLHVPQGMIFMGFADHPYDQNVYLSYIQQASEGKFFIRRDHTLEPQRPLFFNPFTWIMGQAVRVSRVTLLQIYYITIAFYAFLLFYVIYWFISLFIPDPRQRIFAFALCAFSSGLCWLIPSRQWEILFQNYNIVPIDYWIAETITFETIFSVPQKAATALLMLLTFGFFLKAIREKHRLHSVYGGLSLFALSLVHPVDVATVAIVLAAYVVVMLIEFKGSAARAITAGAVIAVTALPAFLYMVYLFKTEPVFIEWSKEKFLSPHPLSYIIGYGIVLLLAIPEIVWIFRRGNREDWLLAVWVLAVAVLLYVPTSFQRRLSTAVHVPLCILAARWTCRRLVPAILRVLGSSPRSNRAQVVVMAGIFLLTTPANIVKIASCITDMKTKPLEFYMYEGDVEAMKWMMTEHNEDAPILSTYKSGLYLPAYTGNRVYVGHWSETLKFAEKARIADWLLFSPGEESAKREFLKEKGIHYIYFGNFERMRGRFALEGAPYLREIYRAGGVAIFQLGSNLNN
ncbi:MAG: hypothetical protein NT045_02360 [Candidatus Aureabacteria bacterium]|nr:hypothetical protein [Candidatus Auribacterota bacterium]